VRGTRKPRYVEPRQIVTIVLLVVCLAAVLVLKSRCGAAVSTLFQAVDQTGLAPKRLDGGARD
jgi:hypothetical protein